MFFKQVKNLYFEAPLRGVGNDYHGKALSLSFVSF